MVSGRRWTTALLMVVGLALVVLGVRKWLDHRAATDTVHAFLHALTEGDRNTVLSLLHPEQRPFVEKRTADERPDFRAPHPGVKHRIHHLEITGSRAVAELRVEKDGFVVRPLLHLSRSETSRWKIRGVENLEIDRRWLDLQRERSRAEGERLAGELGEALEHRPGVMVDRLP